MTVSEALAAYAAGADDAIVLAEVAGEAEPALVARWCNPAFHALCGCPQAGSAGCDGCRPLDAFADEGLRERMADALRGGRRLRDDGDVRGPDGRCAHVEIDLRPAGDGLWFLSERLRPESPASAVETAFARLCRVRAAEAGRRREIERQALVARHARDVVVVTDARGRLEWANPAFYALTGLAEPEAIGRTPGSLLQGPATDPAAIEAMRRAIAAREACRVELVNYSRAGRPYWVEIEISPTFGPDGALEHFVAVERDVTERKREEAERARLAERLGLALDIARIGVWQVDLATRENFWDARVRDMLDVPGDPAEPVSVATWRGLIHPDDVERVFSENEGHFRAGGRCEKRYRAIHRDGSVRWLRSIGQLVDGPHGPRAVGVVMDVTEEAETAAALDRAAKAISDERALLRALIDTLPDAMLVKDLDSRFMVVNRFMAQVFGYDHPERMVGLGDADILPPPLAEAMLADDSAALASGRPLTRRAVAIADPGGAAKRIDFFRAPLRDAAGRIVGLVSTARDVTEEHALREQLEELAARHEAVALRAEAARQAAAKERALLRTLIDAIPDAIYAKDREARFTLKNRYDAELMGVANPEDLVGKTDHDFYPRAAADAFRADDMRVIENGESIVNREERVTGRDGPRWFSTTKVPLRDPDGRIVGLVGVGRDVTAEHDLRERLRVLAAIHEAAAQRAESASEAKSRFLAVMSHELRTPMNGMLGLAALLEHAGLDARGAQMARAIRESGEGLLAILDDILDYSALDQRSLELRPAAFAVSKLVRTLRTLNDSRARAKGVGLRFEAPGAAGDERFGDVRRLAQILHNLIDNAIKFSPGGVVTVRIAPGEGDAAENSLVCEVRDQGVGMSPDQLDAAFVPFAQADGSMTRSAGGAGLGLSIVKGLVEAMGGALAIETAPGAGCAVRFTLPLRRLPARRRGDPTPEAAADAPGLRALLVLPNGVDRVAVRLMLATEGFDVVAVDGPDEAALAARAGRFDLVLLDLATCGEPAAALAALRRETAGDHPPPVLALAARTDTCSAWAALDAGFAGALTKPVEAASLHAEIARLSRELARAPDFAI